MKELSSEEGFVQLKSDHVRLRAKYANWTEAIRGSAALFTDEEVTSGFLEALLLREKNIQQDCRFIHTEWQFPIRNQTLLYAPVLL